MTKKKCVLKNICWIEVLLIAVGFIIYGCAPQYMRNEWKEVLSKAGNICFQCIGLG